MTRFEKDSLIIAGSTQIFKFQVPIIKSQINLNDPNYKLQTVRPYVVGLTSFRQLTSNEEENMIKMKKLYLSFGIEICILFVIWCF